MSALLRLLPGLLALAATPLSAQETIRSKATVNFTFDEDGGPVKDSATVGQSAEEGQLKNDPVRVSSPFWNQAGKKALPLDAARQQFVEVADGTDLDRIDALTFSLLFVNLHDPNDAAFHGLLAKRGQVDGRVLTNYGINFGQQSDTFQVYLSDGSGYKVVQYSTQAAVPVRKLVFLTATYLVADAPGTDADTEADDVRIQLFVNGEPLKPKAVSGGLIEANDGWITDVTPAGLANDLPFTIGRSEAAAGEYLSGVVDEFSLFPAALTPEQIKQLFLEVGGANVRELIALDGPATPKTPVVASLSQPAIQIGQPTALTITGNDLGPNAQVFVPLPNVQMELGTVETNRLVVNVTAANDVTPGLYPLWVTTPAGISRPAPLVLDRMQQLPAPTTGPEAPQSLPAAFFGNLSGSAQPKVHFTGKKGQRLVADVELKRLGGQANPVIEIKSAQGTPLNIAWGHHSLRGDARAEIVLPKDGVYAVELHDLTYNAPGQNSYRIKLGDLKLIDAVFPAVLPPGQATVTPIGTGFTAADQWTATISPLAESRFGLLNLPAAAIFDGRVPLARIGQSTEVLETPSADSQLQTVTAKFQDASSPLIGVNGRLRQRGERDNYLLQVTPGQALRFVMQTASLSSPAEGEITIFHSPQGNVLAQSAEQPALSDVVLDYMVPADQQQLIVGVRDLLNRGGDRFIYRLEVSPGGRPSFDLTVNTPVVDLAENGTAILELQVTRAGYDGPIALRVSGDPGVTITPAQVPAGIAGKLFVRLSREGRPATAVPLIRVVGESVGVQPAINALAKVTAGVVSPAFAETLALGTPASRGLSVELPSPPAVAFRGVPAEILVTVKRQAELEAARRPVRFALTTTEAPRLRVPNNPGAGMLPVAALVTTNLLESGIEQSTAQILVPIESVEPAIEMVLRAESINHSYSERVLGTEYSAPFRVQVQNAVAPKVDDPTLAIVTDADHRLTGQLQRTAGFTGPVEVTVVGLPGEYQVTPATVAGDQGAFAVAIKGPRAAQETPLANVRLRVTSQGSLLLPEQPIAVKAVPPAT